MAKSAKSDIDALMNRMGNNGASYAIGAREEAKRQGLNEADTKVYVTRIYEETKKQGANKSNLNTNGNGGNALTTVTQKQVNSAPTQPQPQKKPSTTTANESVSTGSYVGSIQTKYGNHTYGCKTQAEYDAVMEKVESVVAEVRDKQISSYYKMYKEGQRAENFKTVSKECTELKKIDQTTGKFIQAVSLEHASKVIAIASIEANLSNGASDPRDGTPDSAYDVLFRDETDCDALAQVYCAIRDAVGFSTQIIGTSSHAWSVVKIGGQWWSSDLRSAALSGEAITDPTY